MKAFFVIALTLISTATFAIPVAPFDALAVNSLKSRDLINADEYDFEGIVKLSNCSGSLVIFSGMECGRKPGHRVA